MAYLGHFAQDKWIQKGHNDVSADAAEALAVNSRQLEQEEVAKQKQANDAVESEVQKVRDSASAQKQSDADASQKEEDYKNSAAGKKDNYENAPMAKPAY